MFGSLLLLILGEAFKVTRTHRGASPGAMAATAGLVTMVHTGPGSAMSPGWAEGREVGQCLVDTGTRSWQ